MNTIIICSAKECTNESDWFMQDGCKAYKYPHLCIKCKNKLDVPLRSPSRKK